MQYDVASPDDYMTALENDWRKETLQQLRAIILETDPSIVEGIRYKMLSYGDENGIFLQLNAQRSYVSLYVGNAKKVDASGELLDGLDVGKGCIRFKKSVAVADSRINEFISRAVSLWKSGVDIDC